MFVVDAGGRFLSYCIGWLDANGFGHFELVGRAAADQPLKMAIARVSVSLRELSGQPLKRALFKLTRKKTVVNFWILLVPFAATTPGARSKLGTSTITWVAMFDRH